MNDQEKSQAVVVWGAIGVMALIVLGFIGTIYLLFTV